MSFFDSIGSAIGDALGPAWHAITGIPNASEKREMASQVNSQIQAYKDQTELTRQQINKAQASEGVQKRLVEEKQIRALRGNYRPVGLLSQASSASGASGSTLGGASTTIPEKKLGQ